MKLKKVKLRVLTKANFFVWRVSLVFEEKCSITMSKAMIHMVTKLFSLSVSLSVINAYLSVCVCVCLIHIRKIHKWWLFIESFKIQSYYNQKNLIDLDPTSLWFDENNRFGFQTKHYIGLSIKYLIWFTKILFVDEFVISDLF